MGSEDLPAVGTSGFGGAVGVQGWLPFRVVNLRDGARVSLVWLAEIDRVAVTASGCLPGSGA